MVDICLCTNKECDKHPTCVRGTAKPAMLQSYSRFAPNEAGNCRYYIPVAGDWLAPNDVQNFIAYKDEIELP